MIYKTNLTIIHSVSLEIAAGSYMEARLAMGNLDREQLADLVSNNSQLVSTECDIVEQKDWGNDSERWVALYCQPVKESDYRLHQMDGFNDEEISEIYKSKP